MVRTILLYLQGASTSKTITINGILTAAIIFFAQQYGIDMDAATAASVTAFVFMILNWILRTITGKSLPEKALERKLKKPEWVSVLAKEVLDELELRNAGRRAEAAGRQVQRR